ncbi:Di-copper centre-containing protein [Ramicandelaber brevisporus]|nr:Di-copper centre-containing protein [Ramicandelaber brevisporus]
MRFSLAAFTTAAVAAVTLLSSTADAQCKYTVVRKEFRQMSSIERQKFFNALRALNSGSRPNQFDRFAQVHVWYMSQIHGNAQFLPWHRQFVRDLEIQLQRAANDGSIFVPYWDWSRDSQNPRASRIFSNEWIGNDGNGGNGCAYLPALGGRWIIAAQDDRRLNNRCLRRNFNNQNMNAYYSTSAIETAMDMSSNYIAWSTYIEGAPHGVVHMSFNGDLSTMASPNDPAFFFHHAFIDKLWDDWMQADIGRRQWDYAGRNFQGRPANYYDKLTYYGNAVWTVLPMRNLCYSYTNSPGSQQSRGVDNTGGNWNHDQDETDDADLSSANVTTRAMASSSTNGATNATTTDADADADANANTGASTATAASTNGTHISASARSIFQPPFISSPGDLVGGTISVNLPPGLSLYPNIPGLDGSASPAGILDILGTMTNFLFGFASALLNTFTPEQEKFKPKMMSQMKHVTALSDGFIQNNGLQKDIVRAWEYRLMQHVKNVNQFNGIQDDIELPPKPTINKKRMKAFYTAKHVHHMPEQQQQQQQ